MAQQMARVLCEDIFGNEPVACFLIQRAHIAEDGIDKDMFVGTDIKRIASTDKLLQIPLVKKSFQPLLSEQVAQYVLQTSTLVSDDEGLIRSVSRDKLKSQVQRVETTKSTR